MGQSKEAIAEAATGLVGLRRHRGELIDCDVHVAVPDTAALLPFFNDYWRNTIRERGVARTNLTLTAAPPRAPVNSRPDWRPQEGPPGSWLDRLQADALDGFGPRFAILNCVHAAEVMFGDDLAAAFCSAVNDWLVAEWLDRDPRLRASIVVPVHNVDLAVAEIERCAKDPRFVQVLLPGAAEMPYGRRPFWPVLAAAERHGLAIGIHAGSSYRSAPTAVGWSSFFLVDYVAFSTIAEGQLMSLITEGVFQKFPALKVVFAECGFMWYPAFIWRADKTWRGVRTEIPWVDVPPSEVAEAHVRFTLQPVDAPPDAADLAAALTHLGSDRMLLFSSDYPHWHYDGLEALPTGFPEALTRRVLVDNPLETYPRLAEEARR